MTMGSRIAVMSEGLLQQVGTPQTLYDQPSNRFVAGFIGSPSMNFIEGTVEGTGDAARLKGPGDFSIPVPARYRQSMDTSGRKVTIGFRPEHLELDEITEPSGSFGGRADVVEYLGNEELLHVTAAEQDIVAIVDSSHRVKPGDVLKLNLPLSKLHLFDAESGATLVPERVTAAA
jgi:multiple sugar transport system ATP-binding protein